MSLCVMFSRYEQHNRHRDGRNNKADRTRHLWQPWVERAADYFDDHSRSLSLRCSAMEGTVGTVGKWKRERRHRAVCTSPVSPTPPPNSQEPLDMTTTAGSRALPKERASVIMASPATGHRALSSSTAAATGGISDTGIDEHFRRSLGKDYMNVFAPAAAQRQQQQVAVTAAAAPSTDGDDDDDDDDDAGLSAVDDHFAKALGDTWVKLQKEEYQKKRKETAAAAADGRQKVNVYAA
ncbi:uncharacterized LOC100161012 isoform X2 [Acyrthosiphon pisum]|uniref:Transcription cofactor vestigial-like protein 4 n=1 Tax=Acyrthosiphon pisum TaxID=7029 RepID=A0A8R2B194_ACYPI|nr:uncharacterized LOC100161012 isoform X2 [Acyrthosiphon pisum]|eukprot:XP_008178552.1 PREDICTED: uncharacterized protein LOC100161012 isoform X2 [Acyrthosiphon pisum]